MAEDEIRKHTQAAYKILKDPEVGWKLKLRDIFIEVLIIVFAITVSIWFHNLSDKRQSRTEQDEFLTGLKKDLKSDIENIQNSLRFYEYCQDGMKYFIKVSAGDTLSRDSLRKYGDLFFSSTELEPHGSRYEGLKSSGKLGIIENKDLLNNIIKLNETSLSRIQLLNGYYLSHLEKLSDFIEQHAQLSPKGEITNGSELLRTSQMLLLLEYTRSNISNNLIPAHKEGIAECTEIIDQINKEESSR
jgi:hypothetical protein